MGDNLPAKKETTPTFTFLNKDTGLLETRNAITGDLVALQTTPDPLALKAEKATVVKIEDREILVEPGVSLDKLEKGGRRHKWVYSKMMAEIICQRIAEGESLTKVCRDENMPPYSVVNRWRHEHSSFEEMIQIANRARAEYHRDMAVEIAESHEHDEDVAGAKLLVDTHKWAAGADHSEKFGNKKHVETKVDHTVTFVVDTGIRRPDDPGYNKDQTRLAQERVFKEIKEAQKIEGELPIDRQPKSDSN